jgi:endonuclease-3
MREKDKPMPDSDHVATPPDRPAAHTKIAWVYEALVRMYGIPPWEPDHDPVGGLIATVLSQHTSDMNSERAYAELVHRFPAWQLVRNAPVAAVADAIRSGGLARQKAARIQQILRELSAGQSGSLPSLDVLDDMSLEEALEYLQHFSGVGPKTAACVLLFSSGRPAFPVDTHVLRVTKRLGLIGSQVSAEAAHDILTRLIPAEWRHTMHVDLIRHGRQTCYAQRPACSRCALRPECLYFWDVEASKR